MLYTMYIRWIESAKNKKTRDNPIKILIEKLNNKKKYSDKL